MGKVDLCEDVPHKKRGRPKVNKTQTEPYQRPRIAPSDEGSTGKWKGSSYEPGYQNMTTSPQQLSSGSALPSRLPSPPRTSSLGSVVRSNHSASSSMSPYSPSAAAAATMRPSSQPPDEPLFTMFCSTELKILRVTPSCHALTGFHPHEFVNLNLLDWVAPSDRQVLDMERARLVSVPYLQQGQLQSSRETHAAIMKLNERELLSPAIGMREPYPHQNVRIQRADNGYSLFNVRLHLGGGLGGNIWQPETIGQIYLVVSCLLLSSNDLPPESRRTAPFPPTPVTPLPPPPPHLLPSFSSIAAAADVPARDRERERDRGDYAFRLGSGSAPVPPPPGSAPPPTLEHGGPGGPPPPGYAFRPGTAHTHSVSGSIGSAYSGPAPPRRSPSPPYSRPYTSYPPPLGGYRYEREPHERDFRELNPRELPQPRELRDLRDGRGDPRELRDLRDPRELHDPREPRDPRDLRDVRDDRDMPRQLREREHGRDDDWRRSAPPTHPHSHAQSPSEASRYATYPPPPGVHGHNPVPHPQHQPPHPPPPPASSHQPPPPTSQGAFRTWEL